MQVGLEIATPSCAFYRSPVSSFVSESPALIIGKLSAETLSRFSGTQPAALRAWTDEIGSLQSSLKDLATSIPASHAWTVFLEYPLLRLQKRIDAVLLARDLIFVLEFKEAEAGSNARAQVEDYALDLRDFHKGSLGRTIVPVLVTGGGACPGAPRWDRGGVHAVTTTSPTALSGLLHEAFTALSDDRAGALDANAWESAPYCPVPTIVEAAQLLYASHNVGEVANAGAGEHNLTLTTSKVLEYVREARNTSRRHVIFVTGIPGSGKTLVGLNTVHNQHLRLAEDVPGAFLSGNMPLVEVLREALAVDSAARTGERLGATRRQVTSEIQPLMGFLEEYLDRDRDRAPHERVIVYDEAQRAWDAEYGKRKFGREASEPFLFLDIMARHPNWSVIVALVGGGQELNTGERGLEEWGRALASFNGPSASGGRVWRVFASPVALSGIPGVAHSQLFAGPCPDNVSVTVDSALHLTVPVRSHRCSELADWVDAALSARAEEANATTRTAAALPVWITRSLSDARSWLKSQARGFRRCGLVASSGARRLRAEGLGVSLLMTELDGVVNWFLKPSGDVRSSYALEVTASEYTCQGLELDYVGICWDGDFLFDALTRSWRFSQFKGTQWQNAAPDRSNYIRNAYRVLLTRARAGCVIWVPPGSTDDPTRDPRALTATYDFLVRCGARPL
ncbi:MULTISPECIES: DUF2075 domain-containing protein [unclassified Anaeromyxobacter]|uniref:DUF2075 domain-containing protein n=1 Tax=unclassified Anaeromyxobacter TaxID=2620896 RepID=UPI001F5A0C15|nr:MULTISPECIES: DUF2075 domain-containing protein [unclassified Anaeromyxobacter]